MAAAAMAVSRVAGTVYIQRSTVRMRCSRSAIVLVWLSVIVSSLFSMDSRRSPSTARVTAWALNACSGIIDVPVDCFFFFFCFFCFFFFFCFCFCFFFFFCFCFCTVVG